MSKLQKYALIIDGAEGIGYATAKMLGKSGYHILLNGKNDKKCRIAKSKLEKLGISVDLYMYDTAEEEEVINNFNIFMNKYKKIDVLVNNVGGIPHKCELESMRTGFYYEVIAMILDSVFFNTRACIPLLKNSEYPSIINVTAADMNEYGFGNTINSSANAGVLTMTRELAKELFEYDIRVNAVSHEAIETIFQNRTNKKIINLWQEESSHSYIGVAEKIASVIVFLTSKKASYITGEIIQVNGGKAVV